MKTLFIGSKSTGSDARRTRWGVLASSLAALALLAAPLAIDIGTNGASGLIGSAEAAPRLCDDGTRPPCDDGGGNEPPDFGDLIKLYRNDSGVPILTADGCWQPLPSDACPTECTTLAVDELGNPVADVSVVSVDPATCAVVGSVEGISCQLCTQEVDFGRINEARSPDAVFDSQLEDVLVKLATSDCNTLDPAGRMVATTVGSDLSVLVSTIDSPLQNLAIYRQLIQTGSIGTALPQGASILDTAARGRGSASDKAGEVDVDLVAYLNQIMGLSNLETPTILDPKICILRKQEVAGVVQDVQECFLDYTVVAPDALDSYAYNREANFLALPTPPYIPEGAAEPGTLEFLAEVEPPTEPPTFEIVYDLTFNAVFQAVTFESGNIGGFAQASDDARAVIEFMHENQVPVDFESPVVCEASPEISYDVSISPISGLQVPKNIVDGSEGREFTVTVVNGGPDVATGTVTVTANPEQGNPIDGSPWTFGFTLDPAVNPSGSFTELFTIDIGQATVINWTATATAEFDVNPTNNTVTEVSNVRVNSGGGGGGGNPN